MKVLKVAAIVVGVAALAITGVGLAAGASLAASFGAATTAFTAVGLSAGLSSAIVLGALAIDFGMVSSALSPKPKASGGGSQERWKSDPFAGIPYMMGRSATGGNIIYKGTSGTNNTYYSVVTALSLGLIAGVETTTLDANPIGNYSAHAQQSIQLGACPEASALSMPLSAAPGWDASCKLSGLAASALTFKFDSASSNGFTAIPTPLWVLKGVLVYDPRLDSTYPGGDGPCRALDESTYVYSENPGLHGLTWCLGRFQNGVRVAGIGSPVTSLDVASFVECANLCDARGWVIGGQVYTRPDTLWNSLQAILQAGGSTPVFYGGRISCINRAPRISLATITHEDIVGNTTFQATQTRRDRINQVVPNYRSEANQWQVVAAQAVSVPAFVSLDGDERTKEINYPLVQNVNQVAQLATYDIYDSREAGPGKVQVKPHWLNYRPGDCVTFEPEDGASIKVQITGRELDANSAAVTLDLTGETDAKHDFALGKTGVAPPVVALTYSNAVAAPASTDWSVAGTSLDSSSGAEPALIVSGQLGNPSSDAIIFEYREHAASLGADDGWQATGTDAPTITSKQIAPVKARTTYDVSVRYRVRGIVGERRIIGPVTSGEGSAAWAVVTNKPANVAGLVGYESIKNSDVAINSDGSLSGAGGGKVSITGLGYTGDLDATDGATAGVNLNDGAGNTLTAAQIVTSAGTSADTSAVAGVPAATITASIASYTAKQAATDATVASIGTAVGQATSDITTNKAAASAETAALGQQVASDRATLTAAISGAQSNAATALTTSNTALSTSNSALTTSQARFDAATAAQAGAQAARDETVAAQGVATSAANAAGASRDAAQAATTLAGQSASSASGSAATATNAATIATNAAGDSKAARDAANDASSQASANAQSSQTSAMSSSNYAATASGYAGVASQKANDAGQAAIFADASANTASTQAGQAGVYASQASQSANSAAGSASSATQSASVAASTKDSINNLLWTQYPPVLTPEAQGSYEGFDNHGTFFTSDSSDWPSPWVYDLNTTSAPSYLYISHSHRMPRQVGRRFRITTNVWSGDRPVHLRLFWHDMDNAGNYRDIGTNGDTPFGCQNSIVYQGGWVEIGTEYTVVASNWTYVLAQLEVYTLDGSPLPHLQITGLKIEDVTSEANSAGFASAAATSASNASAAQTAAGQSATAAQGSATSAQTSAGQASASASSAAASSTNSAGSANSASQSAGVSAAAAASAQQTAINLLPDRPSILANFTQDYSGSGHSRVALAAVVHTVAIEGDVAETTCGVVATRGTQPITAGRTYRCDVRGCSLSTGPDYGWIEAGVLIYDQTDNFIGYRSYSQSFNGYGDWQSKSYSITTDEILANWPTATQLRYYSYAPVSYLIAYVRGRDVTSEVNAAGSASAAANSASNASASQTAAGQSASSAQGSATSANTSAGQANTAAGQASQSATDASGSKNSAASSASVAASAAGLAQSSLNKMLPDAAGSLKDFVNPYTGAPDDVPAVTNYFPITTYSDPAEGVVMMLPAQNIDVGQRGWLPIGTGQTFRVHARARAASGTQGLSLRFYGYDANGSTTCNPEVFRAHLTTDWQDFTGVFTSDNLPAGSVNVRAALWNTWTQDTTGVIYVSRFGLENITAQTAAATSATAAANSAFSAAASNTAAGQSASSAQSNATNASTSAGQANTYANNAANSAAGSAGSANTATSEAGVATSAAGQAATARDQANSSATAAASSAATASSKSDSAGQSAASAQGYATNASTSAGQASTSAGQASQSASDASGSKNSAALSATVAANAGSAAIQTVAASLPSDFAQGSAYWSPAYYGPPTRSYPFDGSWLFRDGVAIHAGGNADLSPLGSVKLVAGRNHRVTATWQINNSGGGAAATGSLWAIGFDASYNAVSYPSVGMSITGGQPGWASGYAVHTIDIVDSDQIAQGAVYMRPLFRYDANGSDTFTVVSIKVEDVTNAKAAASSASQASAAQTAAGQSASAAQGSATSAQTAAGQAGTYATNASQSASGASDSANTATSQAGVASSAAGSAATARDQAGASAGAAQGYASNAATSATAAAGSASSASSKADSAGQSATAAQSSSTTATTAAGQAQTYLSQVAQSASDAAGSANVASSQAGIATSSNNGALARVSAEEGARASADSALSGRIDSITSAYQSGDASLSGAINSEATARSSADGSLSSRIDSVTSNYQSADSAINATVSQNYQTLTNADAALANRALSLESNFGATSVSINPNAKFSAWATGDTNPPNFWQWWQQNGSVKRITNDRNQGGNTCQITATSSAEHGIYVGSVYYTAGWYVLDADVYTSGSWQGSGVTLSGAYNFNFATMPDIAGNVGANAQGNRKFSQLFQINGDGPLNTHLMVSWGGFGGGCEPKLQNWYGLSIRAASDAEVKAQKVYNTDLPATIARIGTEETTRASGDSALSSRIDQVVSGYQGADSALSSTITNNYNTLANANSAVAQRTTNLESYANTNTSNLNNLTSRVSTAERAITTNANSIAQRVSTVEAGVANYINRNPLFSVAGYSASPGQNLIPPGWDYIQADGGSTTYSRADYPNRNGTPGVCTYRAAGQNSWLKQTTSNLPAGWYVLECEVEKPYGYWDTAGVLCQLQNCNYDARISFSSDPDINGFVYPYDAYNRRSWSKLFNKASQGDIYLHAMAGWGGFTGGINNASDLIWHQCSIRPASNAEIAAQKVSDANLIARVTTNEGAISGVQGKVAAYWQTTAVAGNNRAQLSIHADANGGAGVDIVGDVSISGSLVVDGTISNSKVADNAITTTKVVDNSITNGDFVANNSSYTGQGGVNSTNSSYTVNGTTSGGSNGGGSSGSGSGGGGYSDSHPQQQ